MLFDRSHLATLCALALVTSASAARAADFTQGVAVAPGSDTVWFKSTVSTTWVDLHYKLDGGAQQNVRMNYVAADGRQETPVVVKPGSVLTYSFTYNNGNPAYDTAVSTFVAGSSSTGSISTGAASGPVCFFADINYAGSSFCASADSNWVGGTWNDRISSVKVQAGNEVDLFGDINYSGAVLKLTADTPNLVSLGFNDVTSSFRLHAVTKSAKRGIAYDLASAADLSALAPGVSWWYDWGLKPNSAAPSNYKAADNMDFIPMLWNTSYDQATVESWLRANPSVKYLLVLNEPNLTGQSNLTPQQAAQAWPGYEKIAADTGVQIVGPAITWGTMPGYSDPVVWLDAFYAAYENANGGRSPRIDYLAFHWYDYGLGGQLDRLTKYGKPFWVTEMANWHQGDGSAQIDSVAKQEQQMTDMVNTCESRADVFRYSWFTGRWSPDPHYTSLLSGNGQLTELGSLYLSLPYAK